MTRPRRKAQVRPSAGEWNPLPHGLGIPLLAAVDEESSAIGKPTAAASPSTPTTTTSEQSTPGTSPGSPSSSIFKQPGVRKGDTSPQNAGEKLIVTLKIPDGARLNGILTLGGNSRTKATTTEDQPPPTSPEINIAETGGRQLRPRKRKLEHGVSTTKLETPANEVRDVEEGDAKAPKKPKSRAKTGITGAEKNVDPDFLGPNPKKMKSLAKATKDNKYGLMPGLSPFPEWPGPSAEQCQEVFALLKTAHPNVQAQAPAEMPTPSLERMGCGDVPCVLDALFRTMLSGATQIERMASVLNGLVQGFGVLREGIGKGSIDWNKVRLAPAEDLHRAIHGGGLGTKKADYIKTILDMVSRENVERLKVNTEGKSREQESPEVQITDQKLISLEHLRGFSKDEAMKHLLQYPGIGVKTSACVILFCLQKPCLAVDTHVYRMSKWLGWVPRNANVDDVFSHLEVCCPDNLKYGLHQLFIIHGKECVKCRDQIKVGSEAWNEAPACPLESLLDRYDKGHVQEKPSSPPKAPKAGKATKAMTAMTVKAATKAEEATEATEGQEEEKQPS
ncbi:DNA glycosylase [Hypomontagnella submonticulosa]|nr:DNA glycosylase [Hypomontagnella submonticulosa]